MIVIAIIALVFGIIITSANLVKKNGRDGRRQSDLRAIQSKLEEYRADNIYYPTSIPSCGSAWTVSGKTYMNIIPCDPTSGSSYPYKPLSSTGAICDGVTAPICTNTVNYCLYAALENPTNPPPARSSVCDTNSPNTTTYNLEITQP